jgi:hypothetical protein
MTNTDSSICIFEMRFVLYLKEMLMPALELNLILSIAVVLLAPICAYGVIKIHDRYVGQPPQKKY